MATARIANCLEWPEADDVCFVFRLQCSDCYEKCIVLLLSPEMIRSTIDLLDDDRLESFCDECVKRSFCNHVFFAQWHLAEAYLSVRNHLTKRRLTDIPALLQRLVENPYGAR